MSLFPYHERFDNTQDLFRERLTALEQAIPAASEAIRPALVKIHHSVVKVRSTLEAIDVACLLPSTLFGSVSCFDCGTRKMDTFHTSKQGRYHLCPGCFDHRARTGRARSAH
jgi:hypothetical protein